MLIIKKEEHIRIENDYNQLKQLLDHERENYIKKENNYINDSNILKQEMKQMKDNIQILENKLLMYVEKNNFFLKQHKKIMASETLFKNNLLTLQQQLEQLQQHSVFSEIPMNFNEIDEEHQNKVIKMETDLLEKAEKIKQYEEKIKETSHRLDDARTLFGMAFGLTIAVIVATIFGQQTLHKRRLNSIEDEATLQLEIKP